MGVTDKEVFLPGGKWELGEHPDYCTLCETEEESSIILDETSFESKQSIDYKGSRFYVYNDGSSSHRQIKMYRKYGI
jgi:hypothetical protein